MGHAAGIVVDVVVLGHAGCVDVANGLFVVHNDGEGVVDAGAAQGATGVEKSTALVGICIGNVVFVVGLVLGNIAGVTMGVTAGVVGNRSLSLPVIHVKGAGWVGAWNGVGF